jgi:hypothetical protein
MEVGVPDPRQERCQSVAGGKRGLVVAYHARRDNGWSIEAAAAVCGRASALISSAGRRSVGTALAVFTLGSLETAVGRYDDAIRRLPDSAVKVVQDGRLRRPPGRRQRRPGSSPPRLPQASAAPVRLIAICQASRGADPSSIAVDHDRLVRVARPHKILDHDSTKLRNWRQG